jgi:hypothetical protein
MNLEDYELTPVWLTPITQQEGIDEYTSYVLTSDRPGNEHHEPKPDGYMLKPKQHNE